MGDRGVSHVFARISAALPGRRGLLEVPRGGALAGRLRLPRVQAARRAIPVRDALVGRSALPRLPGEHVAHRRYRDAVEPYADIDVVLGSLFDDDADPRRMSAVQFQRQLGLKRYETAFQILHKLRTGMVRPERDQIGTEHPVEVDECFVGGATRGEGEEFITRRSSWEPSRSAGARRPANDERCTRVGCAWPSRAIEAQNPSFPSSRPTSCRARK